MKASASCAPDVQTFVPVTRQPPSTFSARARTLARAAPETAPHHADRVGPLPGGDPRQIRLLLLLGPEPQQAGGDLPVRDPVETDRRARGQQFLGDGEPLEKAPAVAAVLRRDGHAEPAPLREAFAERRVTAGQ